MLWFILNSIDEYIHCSSINLLKIFSSSVRFLKKAHRYNISWDVTKPKLPITITAWQNIKFLATVPFLPFLEVFTIFLMSDG